MTGMLLFFSFEKKKKKVPSTYHAPLNPGSGQQKPKRRGPDFPLSSCFGQLLQGNPVVVPGQLGNSPSNVSWPFLSNMAGTPHQRRIQRES